jgi:hypothetical protein
MANPLARDQIRETGPALAVQARQHLMALDGLAQAGLAILATVHVAPPVLLVPKC